jgi:hypothetical protein
LKDNISKRNAEGQTDPDDDLTGGGVVIQSQYARDQADFEKDQRNGVTACQNCG